MGGGGPGSPAARRADALVEVIRRGVSAPGQAPTTAKATVVVSTTLADLVSGLHGVGVSLGDEVLSPDTGPADGL